MDKIEKMLVTKDDFRLYENVRRSGITNMFDVETVKEASGLSRNQILDIMRKYAVYQHMYAPADTKTTRKLKVTSEE